jgi:hypothetical protein
MTQIAITQEILEPLVADIEDDHSRGRWIPPSGVINLRTKLKQVLEMLES